MESTVPSLYMGLHSMSLWGYRLSLWGSMAQQANIWLHRLSYYMAIKHMANVLLTTYFLLKLCVALALKCQQFRQGQQYAQVHRGCLQSPMSLRQQSLAICSYVWLQHVGPASVHGCTRESGTPETFKC